MFPSCIDAKFKHERLLLFTLSSFFHCLNYVYSILKMPAKSESTAPSTKSKKKMLAEARVKGKQFGQSLSATKKNSSRSTPIKRNGSASSPTKTPKAVQLAKAREYGESLSAKKSLSPVPARRTPVTSLDISSEAQSDAISQSSGSFETANWSDVLESKDVTTQTDTTVEKLKKDQIKEWKRIEEHARAQRKRLEEHNEDKSCDMDIE